jgi:phenylacetic acid degradation operon negative regulatory protein
MRQAVSVSRIADPVPAADAGVTRWIRRTLAEDPPRARSLIVTVWGDALAPHGGEVWLAGLIALLAPFGINERLTRTSVFRLARDGWLSAELQGRQSRYRLTDQGRARFEAAYRRIYAAPFGDWQGEWDMVVDPAGAATTAERQHLRDELRWDGFGTLAAGIYLRPHEDQDALADVSRAGAGDRALVMRVRDTASGVPRLADHARALWDLDAVAAGYRRFLASFGRVIDRFRMRGIEASDAEQCFVVRTLLIHAFRRVMLRDPRLPAELLPLDWPGAAAFALTRDFYRLCQARAEAHLSATLSVNGDSLPRAEPWFHERFGGLRAGR